MKNWRWLSAAIVGLLVAGVGSLATHAQPSGQHLTVSSQTGAADQSQSSSTTGAVVGVARGADGASTASITGAPGTPHDPTTSSPPSASTATSTTTSAPDLGNPSPPPADPRVPRVCPNWSVSAAPDPVNPPIPPTPPDPRVTQFCPAPYETPPEITTSGGYLWGSINQFVSRVTPAGDITKFPLPWGVQPGHLSPGPDGKLWFADARDGLVGYMTPSGAVTTFTVKAPPGPITDTDSVVGGDSALWFTVGAGPTFGYGAIGRVSATGTVTVRPLGTMTLTGLTPGLDGSLWVLDLATVHHLHADGTDSPLSMPAGWWALGRPAIGPDGAVWMLAERPTGDLKVELFRLASSGTFTPIALPVGWNNEFAPMTFGPDGNLWIVGNLRGSVLRLSPNGEVIEEIAVGDMPRDITAGPDGNMWFTGMRSIGRIAV